MYKLSRREKGEQKWTNTFRPLDSADLREMNKKWNKTFTSLDSAEQKWNNTFRPVDSAELSESGTEPLM